MTTEKKCIECGNPVDLKAGDEIKPGFIIAADFTEPDICMKCMRKGWSEASPEDFMKDSGFEMTFESPIQREDLEDPSTP